MVILIGILFVFALILGITTLLYRKNKNEKIDIVVNESSECCGVHEICEKDHLHIVDTEIEYFDDEELDAYAHIPSDAYSDEQVKSIADVFYTLREEEVASWLKSLQLRGIELPYTLRDEVLMVVSERRK